MEVVHRDVGRGREHVKARDQLCGTDSLLVAFCGYRNQTGRVRLAWHAPFLSHLATSEFLRVPD